MLVKLLPFENTKYKRNKHKINQHNIHFGIVADFVGSQILIKKTQKKEHSA